MKTTVIYHRADFDGIFCREIARKFLPEAILIGWDYGDSVPAIEKDSQLYMLDISIDGLMNHDPLIWIDHHKSAIEKYPKDIGGYRIDGVAACRLAWQWFAQPFGEGTGMRQPPSKEDYVARKVDEPLAVRLAGEYDIWDKRDHRAELLQHGLRSCELDANWWQTLLQLPSPENQEGRNTVAILLTRGDAVQYAKTQENADIITSYGFTTHFEGLTFLACNHARFNSHLFTAGLKPEHDACLGFKWDGMKSEWSVSLYHAPGKEHHDLSQIAVRCGGGGHRGAFGFRTKTLYFIK